VYILTVAKAKQVYLNCGKAKQAFGKRWALLETMAEQRQRWNTKTSLKAGCG